MFGFNKYEKLFKSIGKGVRVAIFGTGDAAIKIKQELQKRRRDLELVCFLDSYSSEDGELDGTPVLSPFEQGDLSEMLDVVIVSSLANARKMELILHNFGIREIVFAPKEIVKPLPKRDCSKDRGFKRRYKNILKALHSKEDKRVYELLAKGRLDKEQKCDKIKAYISPYSKIDGCHTEQYFDFINREVIKTALDCGSHNCMHSLMFVSKFPNVQSVLAFEPLYEKFKSELYDKVVQNSRKINILQKGVWSDIATLEFKENEKKRGASFFVDTRMNVHQIQDTVKIEVTTIDVIKKEYNIEKVDFVKMDIENAELQALKGAKKTLIKDRPQLAICIYHTDEQFVEVPEYLAEVLENYIFKVGHYNVRLSETVLYAIPRELYKGRR